MLSFYLSLLETAEEQARFAQIYEAYHEKLLGVARLFFPNQLQAEDAVHDAFLKVIENFEKVYEIPRENLYAWIVTILKNTCLDHLRKEKRSVPQDVAEILAGLSDPRQDPEANLGYQDLRDAIRKLPVEDRELMERKVVLEWTDKEIAHSMGMTVSAVANRIYRARKRLQAVLEQEGIR